MQMMGFAASNLKVSKSGIFGECLMTYYSKHLQSLGVSSKLVIRQAFLGHLYQFISLNVCYITAQYTVYSIVIIQFWLASWFLACLLTINTSCFCSSLVCINIVCSEPLAKKCKSLTSMHIATSSLLFSLIGTNLRLSFYCIFICFQFFGLYKLFIYYKVGEALLLLIIIPLINIALPMSLPKPTVSHTFTKSAQFHRPLSFQSMLRNYQTSYRAPTKNAHHQIQKVCLKEKEEFKTVVDMSKKMRVRTKEEDNKQNSNKQNMNDGNKENIQSNGNTIKCQAGSQKLQLLSKANIIDKPQQQKLHISNTAEVFKESAAEQGKQVCIAKQVNIQQIYEQFNNHTNNEHGLAMAGANQETIPTFEKNDQQNQQQRCMMDEQQLPLIALPIRQLSNQDIFSHLVQFNDKQQMEVEANLNLDKKCESAIQDKQILVNEKEQSKSHNIKTKMSLRILKKKLQSHSIDWVIKDVVKHRRIELDGIESEPNHQVIIQALMSFVKHQLK